MHKAARPSGGMDSSNWHRWRGKPLYHHGDSVWNVVCAFFVVSQLATHQWGSLYVKNVRQHNLKMRLKVSLCAPHWLAPYRTLCTRWRTESLAACTYVTARCPWRPPASQEDPGAKRYLLGPRQFMYSMYHHSRLVHAIQPTKVDPALPLKGQQELHQILRVPYADTSLPGPK